MVGERCPALRNGMGWASLAFPLAYLDNEWTSSSAYLQEPNWPMDWKVISEGWWTDGQAGNYNGHKKNTQAADFPSVWVMCVRYQQGNAWPWFAIGCIGNALADNRAARELNSSEPEIQFLQTIDGLLSQGQVGSARHGPTELRGKKQDPDFSSFSFYPPPFPDSSNRSLLS